MRDHNYIKVKGYPEAGADKVIKVEPDMYEVYTVASAQEGKANRRISQLLRPTLGLGSGDSLQLVKGGRSSKKLFRIKYKQ